MLYDIKSEMDTPTVRRIISYAAFDGSLEGTRKVVRKYQSNDQLHFFGWLENGRVLGICGFENRADKVEIHLFSVDEEARGKGIGSAMIAELVGMYKKPIEAEADDDAVTFYQKCGFTANTFTHPKWGKRWTCVLMPQSISASGQPQTKGTDEAVPYKMDGLTVISQI